MKRKKQILLRVLFTLIVVFLVLGIAVLFVAGYRKKERKEQQRQAALAALERSPAVTPTPAVTLTPTPTPRPTATPTPVPTVRVAFNPDDYWNTWYSRDGLASVNIYDISSKSVSFHFTQISADGSVSCEADVTGEVAGNASQFSFWDTMGNGAAGSFIFDNGGLYVRISTSSQGSSSVWPSVDCIMIRERPQVKSQLTSAPQPTSVPQTGDYYFADSNSRYLTDEELSRYSSADLELAKNEIYARRGRQFVTDYIAQYFNSKSWYQGTVSPENFDESVFNEYEAANIQKIVQWEEKRRSEGN